MSSIRSEQVPEIPIPNKMMRITNMKDEPTEKGHVVYSQLFFMNEILRFFWGLEESATLEVSTSPEDNSNENLIVLKQE